MTRPNFKTSGEFLVFPLFVSIVGCTQVLERRSQQSALR